MFEAIYDYTAQSKDELTFTSGQKIEFVEDLEDGWATGKLIHNNTIGHYPTNFVQVSFMTHYISDQMSHHFVKRQTGGFYCYEKEKSRDVIQLNNRPYQKEPKKKEKKK